MSVVKMRTENRGSPGRVGLAPRVALWLAVACGLCGGYLELVIVAIKKYTWYEEPYVWNARDFLWTIPVAHALLLAVPGALVAALNQLRSGLISIRAGAWLFGSLALWSALLQTPIWAEATFLLALGLGRPLSRAIAIRSGRTRLAWTVFGLLLGILVPLSLISSGWQTLRERRGLGSLPPAPASARNVLLIVWDTVRAQDLSPYDYARNTTPNLARWARAGVLYEFALSPAPWTLPSHSSLFTGRWPYELNTQCHYQLDSAVPTLAEYLASQGYQTTGFVANTHYCSWETGLDRGFLHYEDYVLTPLSLVGRSLAGNWLLRKTFGHGDVYAEKWLKIQSRDARGLTDAFLEWLPRRRRDRPFFAFLNFFDAHAPYLPGPGTAGRFGIRPKWPRDYQFLAGFRHSGPRQVQPRDVQMLHDCYDDCLSFLDEQLGRLLEEMRAQGLLEHTLVIITSDHGEAFGSHGLFGHKSSVYLDQTWVPLVILAPDAPAGRVVPYPVSLRDLSETVVEQLGLSVGAPFPGRSLAEYWKLAPGQEPPRTSAAFSEQVDPATFGPRPRDGPARTDFRMSLFAQGRHYIRDGSGGEHLYDVRADPLEQRDLADSAAERPALTAFRRALLGVLTENPGARPVEDTYLGPYRARLKDQVADSARSRSLIVYK